MTNPSEREDNEGLKFDEVNGEIVLRVKMLEDDPYTQRLAYNAMGMVEYIGLASPGALTSAAVWKIKKLVYVGTGVTEILWADGSNAFNQIWDNYAALSYS